MAAKESYTTTAAAESNTTLEGNTIFAFEYTSKISLTGCIGLKKRSTAVAAVTGATMHAEAAEYLQSTVKGTPTTCSSHMGTVLHDSCVADQKESGCVR